LKVLPKGATKAQANKLCAEIEDTVAKGIFIPTKEALAFKEVAENWIDQKKNNVRASTLAGYQGHLKHYFFDIDPIKINRINPQTVEAFISDKLSLGMTRATLKKVLITFNQVMKYAVRQRLTDFNPVRDAEKPKKSSVELPESEKTKVLTPGQITRLAGKHIG